MKKLILSVALSSVFALQHANADDGKYRTYHVTITNTTSYQIITPPVVIAHNHHYHLFSLGDKMHPASEELATMAETGNNEPLAMMASYDSNVSAVATGSGVIEPGMSQTVTIVAPKRTMFTVAGMLASSNDAFTAATHIIAPRKHQYTHAMSMTYDAGSEMNNEDCDYVPGPPCGGEMNKRTESGEGFVSIHNGIHGIGGLMPQKYDWRGPTAMVRIHNDG